MSTFLRQYQPHELGKDHYPLAWHRCTTCDGKGVTKGCGGPDWRETGEASCSTCLGTKSIKDYVRIEAKHRCQRCLHPYRVGQHGNGEWSPCDEKCIHGGPLRGHLCGDESKTFSNSTDHGGEAGGWVHVGYKLEAQWRILTCHHLNGEKEDCRWHNLVPLCQRCLATL